MKLSEMKQILAAGGIQLTKSLGQNFLHDANQVRRIVEAADLDQTDKVLEVGPGLGPLTELLIEKAGEVLAIEKDERLVQVLRQRFGTEETPTSAPSASTQPPARHTATLRFIHADALEYLQEGSHDWNDWKLVANLPYSVASPILVELAQALRPPKRMVATLQIEVAKRLMAQPGAEDYGVLTLLVQLNFQPLGWFKIPASCFFPAPEVDSACVALARRAEPLLARELRTEFVRLVKRSFSQRRKMMFKLLKEEWSAEKLEQAFAALGLSPNTRAEVVGLEQFVSLTRFLDAKH